MTPEQNKSELSPAARYLILSACFVIIVAGIRSAESIVVPFLLSVFIAVICTSPLFWLKRKGSTRGNCRNDCAGGNYFSRSYYGCISRHFTE